MPAPRAAFLLGVLLASQAVAVAVMGSINEKMAADAPPPYEEFDSRAAPQQEPLGKTPLFAALEHRRRFIDTGSQSLRGSYDLYDLLGIRSHSGSINIDVLPQPADKEHPEPAKLVVNSQSGSVRVNMAALDAPERNYSVSIDSRSGSVRGDLIHGRTTSVVSHSGSINLRFALSGADKDSSTLSTTSESGRSEITVLSPTLSMSRMPIKQMTSTHTVKSGSLSLRYPREWEGMVEGHALSGRINLHGAGVEVIEQGPHYVLAKKGTGSSRLVFHTQSGSAEVYFE